MKTKHGKNIRTAAAALVLVPGALVALANPAAAEERSCRGSLGAITVDNLRVPQGASCTLNGTIVQGQVVVERDATLVATTVRVNGNVQSEGAANVVVRTSSRIGGSVQIKQGRAGRVVESRVLGDIQFDANRSAVRAASNQVTGSIQVVGNTGGASITSNRVNGNLQCKENVPAPTGGGNVVQGNKEDQCARL